VRTVVFLDSVALHVSFELIIDNLSCKQERDFPHFRQLLFQHFRAEVRTVPLKRTRHGVLGRCIHDFDFIRSLDEGFRDGLANYFSTDRFHAWLVFLDVLNVDRSEDGDASLQ